MKYKHCDLILRHLNSFGSITAKEAMERYGCFRLSARIFDLRRKGYNIETCRKTERNRYGVPITFAVYKLVKEE